nr:MAG TPA: Protein of unknown function (DUF3989) [Microviridae sp.]
MKTLIKVILFLFIVYLLLALAFFVYAWFNFLPTL